MTVKVLPDTVAFGTTAVLFEKAGLWYGVTPPDMVNVTLSAAPLTPVTETVVGVTARTLDAPGASIVMVAVAVPPTASSTFSVTSPAVTFAGKVTIIGVPFVVLVFAGFQTPMPAVVLNAFDGSVEVVT